MPTTPITQDQPVLTLRKQAWSIEQKGRVHKLQDPKVVKGSRELPQITGLLAYELVTSSVRLEVTWWPLFMKVAAVFMC